MTLATARFKTPELWRSFMMERNTITNQKGENKFSMQVYPEGFSMSPPDMNAEFTKWAAVEVTDKEAVSEGMSTYELGGGMYAVFTYKGLPSGFGRMIQYIFGEWLPGSEYELDNREHFELLGPEYRPDDPEAEEEVWIPIRLK